MKQSLKLPLPPTLNQIITLHGAGGTFQHGGVRYRKSGYTKAKKQWGAIVKAESTRLQPMGDRVWLHFVWGVRKFASDPDNVAAAAKFVLDGLVDANVLPKDSLMVIQSPYTHEYHRAGKRDPWVIVQMADEQMVPLPDLVTPNNGDLSMIPRCHAVI